MKISFVRASASATVSFSGVPSIPVPPSRIASGLVSASVTRSSKKRGIDSRPQYSAACATVNRT